MAQEGKSNAEMLRASSTRSPDTDANEVRAVVETAKAMRPGPRVAEAPAAALIPMTNDAKGIEEAVNADLLLAEMSTQIGVIDAGLREKLNETYTVFVKCRTSHKPGRAAHAIYLREYPTSTAIPHTNWYARKVKEDPVAPYYQTRVLCQACLLDGLHTPVEAIRIVSPEGDLEVDARWLWRRPKNPERAKVEGETRVFSVSLETQNSGRREALARARKAGYEVYEE